MKGVAAVATGSASAALADKIITAIEGRFRDWLMSGEHAEAKQLVAEILDRENEQLRRYCGCLEEQLDEFGLKAAQRAAGLDEPNIGSQTQPPTTNQL